MDIKPPCKTCDYFNLLGTDEEDTAVGECRRKSPIGDLIPFAAWPRVFDDSWCGKHSKWGSYLIPKSNRKFSAGQD